MSTFQQSEDITEIVGALLAFQSKQIKVLKEDEGQIGRQKVNYANLETITDAIRPALIDCELVLTQTPGRITFHKHSEYEGMDEKGNPFKEKRWARTIELTSQIMHKSGQWMRSTACIPIYEQAGINAAQSAYASETYLRRLAQVSILNIPVTDDDGRGAFPPEEAARFNPRQAHRQEGPRDVVAPTTETWQELFKHEPKQKGRWATFQFQNQPEKMGELMFRQMRSAVVENAKLGGPNPALTACNAHYLEELAEQCGCASIFEALEKSAWDGPDFFKMNALQLRSAFELVYNKIMKPMKEAEEKAAKEGK